LICSATVLDETYPGIGFDQHGVSSLVREFRRFHEPLLHECKSSLEKRIDSMCEVIASDSIGRKYDCLIGVSGGRDSSYLAHIAVTQFGLNPLLVHIDAGWNTPEACQNVYNIACKLGLDLETFVIDWNSLRQLHLAFFRSGTPSQDTPQDLVFSGALLKAAKKFGIKHVLNGGNLATEGIPTPLKLLYWANDLRHVKGIWSAHGAGGRNVLNSLPLVSPYESRLIRPLLGVSKVWRPLNFVTYSVKQASDELRQLYDFKVFEQKHFESSFTKFFEGYWLPKRFNFDMRTVQYSSLILSGQMDRNEAIKKLQSPPIDEEAVDLLREFVADKLEIKVAELHQLMRLPKKFWYQYPNSNTVFRIGEWAISKLTQQRRGGAS